MRRSRETTAGPRASSWGSRPSARGGSGRSEELGAGRDEARGLRLLAGGLVPVDRPARGGPVDPALELEVLARHLVGVAVLDRGAQAPGHGLDRRAVAEVLEALPRRGPDTLLLLLDI